MAGDRQQTKQIPSLPLETVYLLKLQLQPERHTSGLLEAMDEPSENVDQETTALCSPLGSIQIAYSFPGRSVYTHLEVRFLQLLQGDTSKSPGLEPSRLQYCSSTGLYAFAYLETYCLMVWLQISLKLYDD